MQKSRKLLLNFCSIRRALGLALCRLRFFAERKCLVPKSTFSEVLSHAATGPGDGRACQFQPDCSSNLLFHHALPHPAARECCGEGNGHKPQCRGRICVYSAGSSPSPILPSHARSFHDSLWKYFQGLVGPRELQVQGVDRSFLGGGAREGERYRSFNDRKDFFKGNLAGWPVSKIKRWNQVIS